MSAQHFTSYTSDIPKSREAQVFFRAGKNRDGYFDNKDLLQQTDRAIDIFKSKMKGFATGLWLFDNAPSHQKQPANGLSARKMPKNPHKSWTQVSKNGPTMCNTTFTAFHPPLLNPETIHQNLYYEDDHPTMPNWFKGMANISERTRPLSCQRLKMPNVKASNALKVTQYVAAAVRFLQPDFARQKSALEELITSRGHICDFYLKYHCETNFIEMYWGAAKVRYCLSVKTANMDEMARNVRWCLDDVSLFQILR